ncbi:hypothetical protein [Reyranella sp.]|uniref:hypothetical protein n=1 Tax=Reyranella sp. TaxID=1929291 RepID=UPI0011FD1A8F|nr:hypothetical protein [Reyranella sp.]TAJ87517.1 MAG: hypothetical protein EPO50_11055 [Reyranella sp.]
MTSVPTEILIVLGVAAIVAIGIRLFRANSAARREAPHIHDGLMKRAETHAATSSFLRKVCREYKANGHISNRQAEAVAKALARLERGRA